MDFPQRHLPLDPYFLGVLLGDGDFAGKHVGVAKPDPEIRALCEAEAARFGLRLRSRRRNTTSVTHFFSGQRFKPNPIAMALQQLGLRGLEGGRKFVPELYKVGSRTDRLAVLAGLLDTDGSLDKGGYDFVSKSRQLAEDVAFLARSLGLAATVRSRTSSCQGGFTGTYWRVRVWGDCTDLPLRIARKRPVPRLTPRNPLRTTFRLERVVRGPFIAFRVDGNSTYLLADFTLAQPPIPDAPEMSNPVTHPTVRLSP